MSDYEVGYGKPPKHSRFRKGVCANPRGRGKRRPFEAEEILKEVLFAEMDYKEGGNETSLASRDRRPDARRKGGQGDIASAVLLLKMRTHAKKHGDGGPIVIRIINALPNNNIIRKKNQFCRE
jgi:hypothetical protein